MKTRFKAFSALIIVSLFCMAVMCGPWTISALAQKDPRQQNDDSGPIGGPEGRPLGQIPLEMRSGQASGNGQMMMAFGPANLAVNNSFVYVLRGNTLYQIRATDLSLVTQRELPTPSRK